MKPGPRTTAFGLLMALSACAVQRDVPDFVYPPSTLDDTAQAPALQPTDQLIVDASADAETYRAITERLQFRAARLRRAVAGDAPR